MDARRQTGTTRPGRTVLPALLMGAIACGSGQPSAPGCGMSSLTMPLTIMESFAQGAGLGAVPPRVPPRVTGRFVGGPTLPVLLSRRDSARVIAAADGPVPEGSRPGYGVLVTDKRMDVLGVAIYDGAPIPGAVQLGTITVGGSDLPLLGTRINPAIVSNPRCPLFPALDTVTP